MMKRIFLLALGAYALAGNAAGEILDEALTYSAINANDAITYRLLSQEARDRRKEAADALAAAEARRQAEIQARAEKAARWHERQVQFQASLISACQQQDRNNQARYAAFRASINGGKLVDGDPVPEIGDLYDSEPMIKMYLHDSGYNDVSDAQVTKITTYMRANRIRHVCQLGQ